MESISQAINFNSEINISWNKDTFQDTCAGLFPRIGMIEPEKIERNHLDDIGVLVCRIAWDDDL